MVLLLLNMVLFTAVSWHALQLYNVSHVEQTSHLFPFFLYMLIWFYIYLMAAFAGKPF